MADDGTESEACGRLLAALSLLREIANLEEELEKDSRYVKLRELRRVRALYGARGRRQNLTRRRRGETSPGRQAAIDAARQMLGGLKEPIKTAAIYERVKSLGIEIGGGDPRNHLSAMLSNHPDFMSHGRAGWTLREAAVDG